jgi:hypothetical protein
MLKTEKAPSLALGELEPPQKSGISTRLSVCLGVFDLARHQNLTTIVEVFPYGVSVVEQVWFASCLASGDLRNFRLVVRAACALAALRMPPLRIWHSSIF